MPSDLELAQLMFKLARSKGNWEAKYDRLEHFKRFPDLKLLVKQLLKKRWILIHHKPQYEAISLNPKFKREIIEFIEKQMSYLKNKIK